MGSCAVTGGVPPVVVGCITRGIARSWSVLLGVVRRIALVIVGRMALVVVCIGYIRERLRKAWVFVCPRQGGRVGAGVAMKSPAALSQGKSVGVAGVAVQRTARWVDV
jgi:hypothetical protein